MPGQTASDAELGAKILAGWERMSRAVPDGPRRNRRLAEHFDIALRDIEHVRDTRNAVAHPGEAIARHDLERALSIIRLARRRDGASRRNRSARPAPRANPPRTHRPRSKTGRPRGGRPPKDEPGGMWGPAADLRKVWLLIAVVAVVVVVAVVLGYQRY